MINAVIFKNITKYLSDDDNILLKMICRKFKNWICILYPHLINKPLNISNLLFYSKPSLSKYILEKHKNFSSQTLNIICLSGNNNLVKKLYDMGTKPNDNTMDAAIMGQNTKIAEGGSMLIKFCESIGIKETSFGKVFNNDKKMDRHIAYMLSYYIYNYSISDAYPNQIPLCNLVKKAYDFRVLKHNRRFANNLLTNHMIHVGNYVRSYGYQQGLPFQDKVDKFIFFPSLPSSSATHHDIVQRTFYKFHDKYIIDSEFIRDGKWPVKHCYFYVDHNQDFILHQDTEPLEHVLDYPRDGMSEETYQSHKIDRKIVAYKKIGVGYPLHDSLNCLKRYLYNCNERAIFECAYFVVHDKN